MLNSVGAGRGLALQVVAYQMVVVVLVALVCLPWGIDISLPVLLGGLSVASGNALAANIALGGGVVTARMAFQRLVLAMCVKWIVVLTIFAMAVGVGRFAPLPLFAGFAIASIAHPLILNFCARVKRER